MLLGDDYTGRPAAQAAEGAAATATSVSTTALPPKTYSKTAQKILRVQKQAPAPTLFFGNLGFETTPENITELLEAHHKKRGNEKEHSKEEEGEVTKEKAKEVWIRKVRMGTFEDSGLCKGCAFSPG